MTVEPETTVFIGETVILKCDMDHQNGWIFRWFTHHRYTLDYDDDYDDRYYYYYVKSHERRQLSSWSRYLRTSEFEGNTITIKEVARFQHNMYQCQGHRKTSFLSSKPSVEVNLRVHCEFIFSLRNSILSPLKYIVKLCIDFIFRQV